jgi:hypothetical protein
MRAEQMNQALQMQSGGVTAPPGVQQSPERPTFGRPVQVSSNSRASAPSGAPIGGLGVAQTAFDTTSSPINDAYEKQKKGGSVVNGFYRDGNFAARLDLGKTLGYGERLSDFDGEQARKTADIADIVLRQKYQAANETALQKQGEGLNSADLTTDDYFKLAKQYEDTAKIYDPYSQGQQQLASNQNSVYQKALNNALSDSPTAGQLQLESQYARGANAARQSAMAAALSSGASPAAAARAATMSSENFTRGLGDQMASTGMAERLANLDTAAQFGTTQQQMAQNQYQTSLVNQASAVNAAKSLGLDLAGIPHGALMDIGGLAAQNRAIDEQVSQANKDRTLKAAGAAFGGAGQFAAMFGGKK